MQIIPVYPECPLFPFKARRYQQTPELWTMKDTDGHQSYCHDPTDFKWSEQNTQLWQSIWTWLYEYKVNIWTYIKYVAQLLHFFLKIINTFIQQRHMNLNKRDSKDICPVRKDFFVKVNFQFIQESWKRQIHIKQHNFNTDNNN